MKFKTFDIIPHDTKFDFVGKRRIAVTLSLLANLAIILWAIFHGLNFGVDFAGGTEMEIRLDPGIAPVDIRKAIDEQGFADVSVQTYGPQQLEQVKDASGATKEVPRQSYLVRVGRTGVMSREDANRVIEAVKGKMQVTDASFNPEAGDNINFQFDGTLPTTAAVQQAVEAAGVKVREVREQPGLAAGTRAFVVIPQGIQEKIEPILAAKFQTEKPVVRVEHVGPAVGRELRNQGFKAMLYAMALIVMYVGLRFDFRFSPGVLIALVHDAVITLGYFAFTGREFNLVSITVILTVIGYSVNDTVVVYDRIRENQGRYKGKRLADLVNLSINEVLGRTFLTSFATALSLVGLIIYGVGTIFDFSVAMLFGIISGTYSTWFIAAPMTIWLEDRAARRAGQTPKPLQEQAASSAAASK
jgi:preprotein translocase subunit SecF